MIIVKTLSHSLASELDNQLKLFLMSLGKNIKIISIDCGTAASANGDSLYQATICYQETRSADKT